MRTRTTSTPREGHASRGDLVIIWAFVVVGIVAVVISAGYVFNGNLYAYGLCSTPPNTGCSDAPWFSSMSLSFFGGIAAVGLGHRCRDREDSNKRGGEIVVLFTVPARWIASVNLDMLAPSMEELQRIQSVHAGAKKPRRQRSTHGSSSSRTTGSQSASETLVEALQHEQGAVCRTGRKLLGDTPFCINSRLHPKWTAWAPPRYRTR